MTTSAGALDILVSADTAQASSSLDKLGADAERSMQRAARSAASAQRDLDRMTSSIQKQIDTFGMTGAEIQRYELKLRGASAAQLEMVDRLQRMKDAQAAFNATANVSTSAGSNFEEVAKGADKAGHATAGVTRELIVLAHELSQGNFKKFGGSLLVLAEYGGAAVAALSAIALPATVLVAIGAFVVAAHQGAQESKDLANAMQLTGNAAGVTAGQMTAMSRSIAATASVGIGTARTALLELVKTGQFGPQVIDGAATAVVRLEKLTGESSETIVKDFAKMGDGVAKWAEEHNRQMNFITAAQYAYIQQLEETGHKEAAEAETLRLLNEHIKDLRPNLGYLESAWKGVSEWASRAWDAMKGAGRAETTDDRLQDAKVRVDSLRDALQKEADGGRFGTQTPGRVQRLQNLMTGARSDESVAQSDVIMERRVAALDAQNAAYQKAGIASVDYFNKMREESKSASQLDKDLAKLTANIQARKDAGGPATLPEDKAIEAYIRNKDRTVGEKKSDRAQQSLDTAFTKELNQLGAEAARLDAQIESWTKYGRAIDSTHAATVAFDIAQGKLTGTNGAALTQSEKMRALGDAAVVDLKQETEKTLEAADAARKRTAAISAAANAQALTARDTKIATELEQLRTSGLKVGTQAYLDAAAARTAAVNQEYDNKLQRELAQQQVASNNEVKRIDAETASLGMSTIERQKNALAMKLQAEAAKQIEANPGQAGTINDATTKKIEDQTAALQRGYDASRTFDTGVQVAFTNYQESSANAAKFSENVISGSLGRLEDALLNFTKTGKLHLGSLFQFMADEFIKQQIRMQLASATASASGGGGSGGLFGSLLAAAGTFFGGNKTVGGSQSGAGIGGSGTSDAVAGFAVGTNYVPYDNMPAILHKGEAVVPAAYNPANGRGGGDTVQIVNNGQPMTATSTTETQPDGTRLKKIVLDVMTEDVAKGGKHSSAMAQRYGMNRQNSKRA